MNYDQAITDIRAEIERLEREYGAVRAYVVTASLLTALELLAEANKRSIRLKTITISQAREMALRATFDTEAGLRRDRAEDALRQRCFEVKP